MKKNEKLYVARYVPYANRVRNGRIFVLKTALITLLICLILVFVGVFSASKIPKKFYSSIFKPQSKTVQTVKKEDEEKGFVYPKPTDTVRQKADRLRELNLEEWNVNHYTPLDGELDNVYLYDDKKMCYLTFDDGPSDVTLEILDVLEKYKAKATFFVTGQMVQRHPDILKRIYEDGNAIGNHSATHVYDSVYSSPEGFANEVLSCKNAIDAALGFEYKNLVFRFPGGYISLKNEETKKAYVAELKKIGYKFIDWSCLTGDSNVTDPTAYYLIETLRQGIGNSKTGDIVILMHDSSTKHMTAEVLPTIIEYLYNNGYKFATLKN